MNTLNEWYVYMLLCDQKTFYVGITPNPKEKTEKHRNKECIATKEFYDLRLAYCEKYPNKFDAVKREK